MSKTRQISITLPEDLIESIQASVASGEARSVSAYITERLRSGSVMDALFTEWDTQTGPVPESDRQWALSELERVFGGERDGNGEQDAA